MDIKDQKNTWDSFIKLGVLAGGIIIAVLVLMAVFLL